MLPVEPVTLCRVRSVPVTPTTPAAPTPVDVRRSGAGHPFVLRDSPRFVFQGRESERKVCSVHVVRPRTPCLSSGLRRGPERRTLPSSPTLPSSRGCRFLVEGSTHDTPQKDPLSDNVPVKQRKVRRRDSGERSLCSVLTWTTTSPTLPFDGSGTDVLVHPYDFPDPHVSLRYRIPEVTGGIVDYRSEEEETKPTNPKTGGPKDPGDLGVRN